MFCIKRFFCALVLAERGAYSVERIAWKKIAFSVKRTAWRMEKIAYSVQRIAYCMVIHHSLMNKFDLGGLSDSCGSPRNLRLLAVIVCLLAPKGQANIRVL